MSLITRQSSAPKSTAPTPQNVVANSVDEARCNRIIRPTSTYVRAKVVWFNKTEGWTSVQLEERYRKLNSDFLELQKLVRNPPAEWTPETWLKMDERLKSWHGQLDGLEMRMKISSYTSTKPPTTSAPAGTTPAPLPKNEPDSDPFSDE